jgi:hypothetical protein
MRRKRKKSRDYCVTGIIEVCNITPGRRRTTLLNLDEPVNIEILDISGSNAGKSPIYDTANEKSNENKEIFTSGSSL